MTAGPMTLEKMLLKEEALLANIQSLREAIREKYLREMRRLNELAPRTFPSTGREMQVYAGIKARLSNKEIGAGLNISERTVKFHVANLMTKRGVKSRWDL